MLVCHQKMLLITQLLACIIGMTASVKGQNDIQIEMKSEQLEGFLSSFFNGSRIHDLLTLSSAVAVNFKDYNTYSSDFYHDLVESAFRAVPTKESIKRIRNDISILSELSRKLRKSIDEKNNSQWSLLLPSIHDTLLNLVHLLAPSFNSMFTFTCHRLNHFSSQCRRQFYKQSEHVAVENMERLRQNSGRDEDVSETDHKKVPPPHRHNEWKGDITETQESEGCFDDSKSF